MYKLLIVDDETIEREALKFIVKNSSLSIIEVEEACNGQEALRIAEVFQPDMVILDIQMPGMNGLEVAHKLKAFNEDIKIIFMTAFDRFDYAQEALRVGVEAYILKPSSKEQTIEILQNCILKMEHIRRGKQHKKHTQLRLNQVEYYLKNEFIDSVINGEFTEHQSDDYLNYMIHHFHEGFGVVVEIDFIKHNDKNQLHGNKIVKKFLERLSVLPNQSEELLMKVAPNIIYLLVYNYPKGQKQNYIKSIQEVMEKVMGEVNDYLEVIIHYGFGDSYEQISQLWRSFSQAKVASKEMLAGRENENDHVRLALKGLYFKEKQLCASILEGRETDMIRISHEILDDMVATSTTINAIRLKLYESFILLNRCLSKESQHKIAVPENLFMVLENISSIGDAKAYSHDYLIGIFEAIGKDNNPTSLINDQVIPYIQSNYDQDITLEDMALKYGFSTYYFGKMFKQALGTGFIEYLSHTRITQAKLLLRNPELTIKAVAYGVGYRDPNYFTRVFKTSEGITPTEYRDKIMLG